MPFASRRALITGPHRSGTTWLGRVVQQTKRFSVYHEPFNKGSGLVGLPKWYLNKDIQDQEVLIDKIDAFLNGSARYSRSDGHGLKRLTKHIIGGKEELKYRCDNMRQKNEILLKDPFLLFYSDFLAQNYDFKVIIVCRHPAAYYSSLTRMEWEVGSEELLADISQLLAHSLSPPLALPVHPTGDRINDVGRFWSIATAYSLAAAEAFPDRIKLFRHEDLSREPERLVAEITEFLEISVAEARPAISYAVTSTQGEVVTPKPGQLHEFNRNAVASLEAWRQKLSAQTINGLAKATADVAPLLYPEFVGAAPSGVSER